MTECVIVLRFCKSNIRLSPRCVCVGGGGGGEGCGWEIERNHFYGDFEKQI